MIIEFFKSSHLVFKKGTQVPAKYDWCMETFSRPTEISGDFLPVIQETVSQIAFSGRYSSNKSILSASIFPILQSFFRS